MASFFHIADRSFERKSDSLAGLQHTEAFAIDADHDRRFSAGIVRQCIAVVVVRMLDDARWKSRRTAFSSQALP